MPDFSTDFTPPPTPVLTIEADLNASAIRLSWTATGILPEDFGGYRLLRRVGSGDWVAIVEYNDQDSVTYDDFTAPINETVTYQITQFSVDVESEPAEASTRLSDKRWWIVTPADDSLTFPIEKIRGATLTSEKVQDVYNPIGRREKVVVGDVVQTEDGSLSFLVMPDNGGMIALLKLVQAKMDGELLAKAPDGSVHRVRVGTIVRNFTSVEGLQELSLPFIGAA